MKRLIVIAVALLTAVTASAEGFGIVGGYTSSSLKMQEMSFKSSAGIHAGVAYNLPLGAGFNLQPMLLYNVKGFNWEGSNTDALKEQAGKFGYVELPVQLQWGPDLLLLRPYLLAEPFVGYAVTGSKVINSERAKVDWSNMKSRVEYGVGVGAGVEIYNRVQVSFKYYWNFEDATQWSDITDKVKGKGFSGLLFTAGIFF
jgi:hypothetical protein